jgi:hypothetical protein
MGFNISGIINSKMSDKAVIQFEERFDLKLERIDEVITLAQASENKYDSAYVDFYFTRKGYIVFFDNNLTKRAKLDILSEDSDSEIIHFDFSETSMAFIFRKYNKGSFEWKFGALWEGEYQTIGDNMLGIDENTDIIFDTFSKLTEDYLDFNFGKMEDTIKLFRFKIISKEYSVEYIDKRNKYQKNLLIDYFKLRNNKISLFKISFQHAIPLVVSLLALCLKISWILKFLCFFYISIIAMILAKFSPKMSKSILVFYLTLILSLFFLKNHDALMGITLFLVLIHLIVSTNTVLSLKKDLMVLRNVKNQFGLIELLKK